MLPLLSNLSIAVLFACFVLVLSSMGSGQQLSQMNINNLSINLSIKVKKQNENGKIMVLHNLIKF